MDPTPTRREQRRRQTLAEIKALAMEQVTAGGAEALSLNAVGRAMAMSPAAIYRYYAGRDELLAELVIDAYDSLAGALENAGGPGEPTSRLAAIARAYRSWALEHPNSYRLVFQTTSGSGELLAPERTVAAAQRSMDAYLAVLAEFPVPAPPADPTLAEQLAAWGARGGHADLPLGTLSLGLTVWSRLHGHLSLELGGHLRATGLDPGLLYAAEIRELLTRASSPPPG